MTAMTIICAWCNKVLVAGNPAKPVSHGCCKECAERIQREVA